MMWIKGDRTECRVDITELDYYDEEDNEHITTITVATKDADKLLNILNDYAGRIEWTN